MDDRSINSSGGGSKYDGVSVVAFEAEVAPLVEEIVKSCTQLVNIVKDINQHQDAATSMTDEYKKPMSNLARGLPMDANQLQELVMQFSRSVESSVMIEDPEVQALVRRFRNSAKEAKAAVLSLLRLCSVSAWRTQGTTGQVHTQQLLDRSCRDVGSSITSLRESINELKTLEEIEEEAWIEAEAEALSASIKTSVVNRGRECSGAIKTLLETARSETVVEADFVSAAKGALFSLDALVAFSASLEVAGGKELKECSVRLIRAAKALFSSKSSADLEVCNGLVTELASMIRGIILSASALDTTKLVRQRLGDNVEDGLALPDEVMSDTLKTNQRRKPRDTTANSGQHSSRREALSPSRNGADMSQPEVQAAVLTLQRKLRSLMRVRKFRAVALEYLTHPSSERIRKRNLALREILSTETLYVQQLEELQTKVIDRMREETLPFMTPEDVDNVFSNLESIVLLNMQILEIMEKRMAAWPSNCYFGDIFVSKASVFRLYSEYLGNYENQVKALAELETRPGFKEFLKSCGLSRGLGNYLILPVQRLPRYQILLENLIKYTPEDHVDLDNLKKALDKVLEVNIQVDQRKADIDNRNRLQEVRESLQNKFSFAMHKSRKYLREGEVQRVELPTRKKEDSSYVYLLNDMLIVCKGAKGSAAGAKAAKTRRLEFKDVVWFRDGYALSKPEPTRILLQSLTSKNYCSILFETPNTCSTWYSDLEKAFSERTFDSIPKI